jgi:hypothetical protein
MIQTFRDEPHYRIENGCLRLDFDLRSEFPYFNFLWVKPSPEADYQRYCNFGVEAMPFPVKQPEPSETPANVWLMGHDYKVKELDFEEGDDKAILQVSYPPPMVVAGEISALAGGEQRAAFPDWGQSYWDEVETIHCAAQAFWTLRDGEPYADLRVRPSYGELLSLIPLFHHGFCGHDQLPHHVFAGGRFYSAQAPDGSWPSHHELGEDGDASKAQMDLQDDQVFVFFNERLGSTTMIVALDSPHPEGFFFLGRNESPVDPNNPNGFYAEAAQKSSYQPETVYSRGFTEIILFLEVDPSKPLPRLRIGFYPNSPLRYGEATAIREFVQSKPEFARYSL